MEAEVAALTVGDLDLSRIQVTDPTPIPDDELRRTAAWMASWNRLGQRTRREDLIDAGMQRRGHEAAVG